MGLLSSQAEGPGTLLLSRFCFGIAYGVGTGAGMTLLVESVPADWRGHMVNIAGIFFMFGEMFAALLLISFMPDLSIGQGEHYWRWVTGLGVSPGLVMFPVVYFMMQESP